MPRTLRKIAGFTRAVATALGLRNFEAAAGGRRFEGARTISNTNTAILASATIAAQRAAFYCRNNPWVGSAVSSLVTNAVGAGIKPRSRHPNPAVREALHTLWDRWTDHADFTGQADFYGQQATAVRQMIEGGEAFAHMRAEGDGSVPLSIEMIDRTQVPVDRFAVVQSTRVRAAIEFDAYGRRVAYHVLPARPGDPFTVPPSYQTVRIPAEDMAHLFQPVEAGQLRGITWLAPVLLRLKELDEFEDAALVKAKVAALFAGFITDPNGDAAGQAGNGALNGSALTVGMEPGSLIPLPPGAGITFSSPVESTDYEPFLRGHLRAVAAGLGLPYEAMTGDLSGVNYSSIRAGMLEYRRRLEQLQFSVIVFRLCRPIWERFVTLAVLSGALPAHDFETNPADYLAVDWLPPRFDYVDPQKDVAAEIAAIEAGLKSRSQSIAERGYDAEQVDEQIAADRVREKALGLSFASPEPTVPADA